MLTVSTLAARGYHHGELRTALVGAALDLLAENGADAVSLRAVARRAGVFGPKRLGIHPELAAAGEAAYAVLAARVAAEAPANADRDARALGCWSMVHGLASLFLDDRISDKTAAPGGDVTRRVAEAMLGG